ncbi:MAG: response regulator [Acidobacteriota bacterium]
MAKILVVDDEESIRTMLSIVLSPVHTIIVANNGKEGLSLFVEHQPDIVIADKDMPLMSGDKMIRRIRTLSDKVTIIAHSTFPSAIEQEDMLQAGANFCLSKPTDLTILLDTVAATFKD